MSERIVQLCRVLPAIFLFACAQFAHSQRVVHNIPYVTDSTGTYLADLYQPVSAGPAPAVVLIHGGSWRSGTRNEMKQLAIDLAAHGYAGFSIAYDLHPRSFPTSWQEVRAAVRFLRSHATEYNINPQQIAVLGTSAGGQLAALAALAPAGTSASAGTTDDVPVQAAVLLNGGYDLRPKAHVLRRYLGGNCRDIPAVCKDASPLFHVHPGAPPMFVGHGNHDHLIPYSQATTFIAALQAAGDPVTPFVAKGGGHSYWRKPRFYAANLHAVEDFLDGVFHPAEKLL